MDEKYVRPDRLVNEEMSFPIYPGSSEILTASAETPISVRYAPFGQYQPGVGLDGTEHTRSGIVGNSKRANAKKGERCLQVIAELIAGFILELQKVELGEVRRPSSSFY